MVIIFMGYVSFREGNILVNTKVTSVLALECHWIRDLITGISIFFEENKNPTEPRKKKKLAYFPLYSLFIRDLYDVFFNIIPIYLGRISSPIDPEQPGALFSLLNSMLPGTQHVTPNRFTLQRAPRDPPEHNGHPDSRPKRSHGGFTPRWTLVMSVFPMP